MSDAGIPIAETRSGREVAPPRKRLGPRQATVAEVVRETHDTVTVVLEPSEPAEYQAGHFLTVDPHQFEELADLVAYFEDVKGRRESPRAYSLSSSPLEPRPAFTVKEERYERGATQYPPILSPYLVRRLRPGQRITVVGFTGGYVLPPDVESRAEHLVHLVAGSGAVPNYSILKYALAVHPRLRHTFVCSNKTWDDVLFRDGLSSLEARHPERLRVVHALTREQRPERGGMARAGRVGAPLLRELVPDPSACLVFACGPAVGTRERAAARARGELPRPRFLEAVTSALAEIGVPEDRVRTEAYG